MKKSGFKPLFYFRVGYRGLNRGDINLWIELIDQQTICEIKTLLSSTDMSVKEIAATLHFDDTPYMCRYFRQRTGLSPLEYRNGGRRL